MARHIDMCQSVSPPPRQYIAQSPTSLGYIAPLPPAARRPHPVRKSLIKYCRANGARIQLRLWGGRVSGSRWCAAGREIPTPAIITPNPYPPRAMSRSALGSRACRPARNTLVLKATPLYAYACPSFTQTITVKSCFYVVPHRTSTRGVLLTTPPLHA